MRTIYVIWNIAKDCFSTDRIIYDIIANIDTIENMIINFSKEYSMKYLTEQKRIIGNVNLDVN